MKFFLWGRYFVELHIENIGDKSIIWGLGLSNAQRRSLFYRNLCCGKENLLVLTGFGLMTIFIPG